jgi:hypothetical protein
MLVDRVKMSDSEFISIPLSLVVPRFEDGEGGLKNKGISTIASRIQKGVIARKKYRRYLVC